MEDTTIKYGQRRVNGNEVIVANLRQLFIKPSQAAAMLNISRAMIYVLIKRREIPAVRLGSEWRVPLSALETLALNAVSAGTN